MHLFSFRHGEHRRMHEIPPCRRTRVSNYTERREIVGKLGSRDRNLLYRLERATSKCIEYKY